MYLVFFKNNKPITAQAITSFEKKVFKNGLNRCWKWKGSINGAGYGNFKWRFKGKRYAMDAHRFSWSVYCENGEIPLKMNVCHTCDQRLCVRPAHLWIGTPRENTADMIKKGRMVTPNRSGQNNGRALLTWKDVIYIRENFKKRIITGEILGDKFGVKKHVIWNIVQNKTWKENKILVNK